MTSAAGKIFHNLSIFIFIVYIYIYYLLTKINTTSLFRDVSSVTGMEAMFRIWSNPSKISLASWDTSKVQKMWWIFSHTHFNDDSIASWDVSSVISIPKGFENAWSFDKDLSGWDLADGVNCDKINNGAKKFTTEKLPLKCQ